MESSCQSDNGRSLNRNGERNASYEESTIEKLVSNPLQRCLARSRSCSMFGMQLINRYLTHKHMGHAGWKSRQVKARSRYWGKLCIIHELTHGFQCMQS
jgi:hypothetical protein